MTADNQFGSGALVTFANAAGNYTRFEIQGTTQTVAGLQGTTASGIIQNEKTGGGGTTTAGTLIIDTATNHSYDGYMRNGPGGFDTFPLHIVKNGIGTQTFTGQLAGSPAVPTTNIMTYTGGITVNNGKLVGAAVRTGNNTCWAWPAAARTVTVNAGATLGIRCAEPLRRPQRHQRRAEHRGQRWHRDQCRSGQ